MKSKRWLWLGTAVIVTLSGAALADEHGHGHNKHHDRDDDDDRGEHYYRDHERGEMRSWYHDRGDDLPPDLPRGIVCHLAWKDSYGFEEHCPPDYARKCCLAPRNWNAGCLRRHAGARTSSSEVTSSWSIAAHTWCWIFFTSSGNRHPCSENGARPLG